MPIRPATRADLSTTSRLFSQAFYNEQLNAHIFPARAQQPLEYVHAWHEKVLERFWNYSCVFLVSYEPALPHRISDAPLQQQLGLPNKEVIKGVSVWTFRHSSICSPWRIRWWDPRRLISPLLLLYHRLRNFLSRNLASRAPSLANPDPMDKFNFVSRIAPFVGKYLSSPPHRQNHWELSFLGVDPKYQGQGVGSELVQRGLNRAAEEKLPAVVIAAPEKEEFYRRRGFTELVAYASREEEDQEGMGRRNPLIEAGVGGGAIMWTR